jgi:DNA-binding response OmpR family regulator
MRPQGVFVLVVHDSTVSGEGIWDALHDEYIVRDATSAFDALEWLSGTTLACVVCVLGVTFSGEDFFNIVSRLSVEQAKRVVFITARDNPDIAFLRREHCNWLTMPVQAKELLALVGAVSTR